MDGPPPSLDTSDDSPEEALVQEVARLRAELAQAKANEARLQEALDGKATDEAERQRLARRLHARDALLKSLSQHIPGVLFKIVIPAGGEAQLHYISERAAELYELDVNATGMTWASHYERIHPDDLPMVKRLSGELCIEEGQMQRYEYRAILPSKGLRWMSGQSVSRKEGDNGDTAWYGYVQDITEQKLYTEAVIAAQAAERANLAKSEFLSRMSHELRTPLNAVIGFAQLLQMDRSHVFGQEQHRRVNLIEKAGQHLLSMLGDVLDLSRIEAGDLPLSIESVDMNLLADEALSLVSALASANQIQIDTSGVSAHAYAMADRVRVRQVLVNLLSNAIKYNRQGGQVKLRARREGDDVLIQVQDTGIGMTEAQLAHLFEPFNRLGVEQSGIEGSGIGLVIVRRLITLMNGMIEVSSHSGEGSLFSVRLPAADIEPAPSDQIPLETNDLFNRPATILYAEDNEVNVALVHQIVKLRPNWRLLVALNGQRALDLARRSLPDLMLIDMHLGDMTGLQLATELDKDELTSRIPRVALSADAMPDRIHAARANGFKAYLTKPLDVLALLRCLDENLSGGSANGESSRY
jgi:signal transduction histidine kinase/ActR/RegA family two-component response regulator